MVLVSALGSREDREAAIEVTRRELGLGAQGDTSATTAVDDAGGLPGDWEEVVTPEGKPVLVPRLATRRRHAWIVGILAAGAGLALAWVIRAAVRDPSLLPAAVALGAVSAAFAWACAWLWRGRMEWRLGSGRIVLRRRFGSTVRDVFEAHRLELNLRSDSDGDEWFSLDA